MTTLFTTSWHRTWQGLAAHGDGLALRDALLARYSEAHRHYHTTQHLAECLAMFEWVQAAADRPHEVEMALWFHDAVYDLKASDNEARSAAWARDALLQAQVDAAAAQRIHGLIMATRHTAVPRGRDEQVLVDIDLAILGAETERFDEYERQIRSEYAHVPGLLFRMKRKSILRGFLDRESIYTTPALHQELEARARRNLARAVA